jgi:class 3 adenylate cyclase
MDPSPVSSHSPSGDPLEELVTRHATQGGQRQLTAANRAALAENGSTEVEASVVVGDLRLSGFLLKEAVRPALFARFIVAFTEAVRSLTNDADGWFDKFTGDGFVSFWIHPPGEDAPAGRIPEFCQEVLPASESLVDDLRSNSRNFPQGVGLSLGVDRGACELVRVGDALTLVGAPIVGASRMVAAAAPNRLVANNLFGRALARDADRLAAAGIVVRRVAVRTKEYPEGQEAYEVGFPKLAPGGARGDAVEPGASAST